LSSVISIRPICATQELYRSCAKENLHLRRTRGAAMSEIVDLVLRYVSVGLGLVVILGPIA
jgi:hypothetical protein